MRNDTQATYKIILKRPGHFLLRVIRGFKANQGMLLSGAVAYYTLLSIVPLFILLLIVLSNVVEEARLLATLSRYLEFVFPGMADEMVGQIEKFLESRIIMGWVLIAVMLFFSSVAFTMLENAMSVIFFHRVQIKRRHFLVSAIIPYLFILVLGVGFLVVTVIAGALLTFRETHFFVFGQDWSLGGLTSLLLYLIGFGGQVLMLTAIYMVMPVGKLLLRHALIGGVAAALMWEITRHVLVWYFSTLSFVNVVYGSLATVIVALLSLEIAGMILLLGAQVIAEYERLAEEGDLDTPSQKMVT